MDSSMFFAERARRGLNSVFRPQYLVATGPRGKINAGESRELVTDGRETEELTPRNLLWEPVVNKSVFRYLPSCPSLAACSLAVN